MFKIIVRNAHTNEIEMTNIADTLKQAKKWMFNDQIRLGEENYTYEIVELKEENYTYEIVELKEENDQMFEYYLYIDEFVGLFDTIEEENDFIDTLQEDDEIVKHDNCFFFTDSTFNKYPVLNNLTDEDLKYNKFTDYIETQYDEDDMFFNGLCLENAYLQETAVLHAEHDEDFHKQFRNDPEKALKELDKTVKSFCLSSLIGHFIQEINEDNEEGIEINLEVVQFESGLMPVK